MKIDRLNMLLVTVMTVISGYTGSAFSADKVVVIPLSTSTAPAVSKLIFVTNGSWNGNLGGLTGADAKCSAEARSRGFSGTFQALLGSPDGRPEHRSIHYPLPYVTVAGKTIQSDYHDLFNGGPDNPILPNPSVRIWTGLAGRGDLSVLVKHFHRLIPDTERHRKTSIFPACLTQTVLQLESLLPKINFK